jgi:(+)-beta-caryophyllene/(+)-caryolan-1-ol synthase
MREDRDPAAFIDLTGTTTRPGPHGMEDLHIPPLFMPFPEHEPNPARAHAQAALHAWLDDHGICQSATSQRSLKSTQVPLITSLTFPDADPRTLDLLIQWATWTFIIDDEFDDGPDGNDPQRCAAALDKLLLAFDGPGSVQRGGEASVNAFAGTIADLTDGRSAGWCRMFRDDARAFLWSYYEGLLDQLTHRLPTVTAYRRQRAVTVAGYTWLDLVEIAVDVDLPEPVRHLSSFRDLRESTSELVGLHNDLWSIGRDHAAGGFHNAVLLLQQHEVVTQQEAVDQVADLAGDCIQRMLTTEKELTQQLHAAGYSGHTTNDALTCAAGYRKFVRGCVDCHHQVGRYTQASPTTPSQTPIHDLF